MNGEDKATNSSGVAAFTDVKVSGGDITCFIECNGYEPKTQVLSVDNSHTSFTISLEPIIYDFQSYLDAEGTEKGDTGTVQTTGVGTSKWVQVEILTISNPDWEVGTTIYVTRDAFPDGQELYRLYSGAGTGAMDFYVTISRHE